MNLNEIKDTGLLELYVLDALNEQEVQMVEQAIAAHPEIDTEIKEIETALEVYAYANAIKPLETTKILITAVVQFTKRVEAGEQPPMPPELTPLSTIEDYALWLNNPTMVEPEYNENMFGQIIGANNDFTILIKWIRNAMPNEIHEEFIESVLIVEGTCDIYFDEVIKHSLKKGDYLSIPLHINHRVEVTSKNTCKAILQRKNVSVI